MILSEGHSIAHSSRRGWKSCLCTTRGGSIALLNKLSNATFAHKQNHIASVEKEADTNLCCSFPSMCDKRRSIVGTVQIDSIFKVCPLLSRTFKILQSSLG